jgi:hypothetical protein
MRSEIEKQREWNEMMLVKEAVEERSEALSLSGNNDK